VSDRLQALRNSVQHLHEVASQLDPAQYTSPAYPSDWTTADTFSHLGSGAVIGQQSFENSLFDRDADPSFNTSTWDEWNAKDPTDQITECLISDAAYLAALEASSEEQRETFRMNMGPHTFDFEGLVGLRLGEHVLHTWDIEVPFRPDATLTSEAASAVLDGIQFVASRAAKPTGDARAITIRTSDPVRDFTLILDEDSVEFVENPHDGDVDLEIPAEALVRLIYGRLDEAHAPASVSGDVVDYLRTLYPGF
jgi:uncharacterized protein (TIGR03083 family)